MNGPESESGGGRPRRWRARFGLGFLMLVMLVFCVMAAALHYLAQALYSGASLTAVFIIFTLAAPALLLVAVSVGRKLIISLGRHGRRRQ